MKFKNWLLEKSLSKTLSFGGQENLEIKLCTI